MTHPLPGLVLDTNTVLALWMFRDPTLEALRKWIEGGNCRLYSRQDALEELGRVLAYRQFRLPLEAQHMILQQYRARLSPWAARTATECATTHPPLPHCKDQDDQKFLEIAVGSGASLLVTRDRALLKLRRKSLLRGLIKILEPERILLCTNEHPI